MVYAEPDEHWKAQLKSRIQENVDKLLLDAKVSYERNLAGARPADAALRRQYYLDYLQDTQNLKTFAADEYQYALAREREELQWCLQADSSEAWAWVLKDGQAAIFNAIDKSNTSPVVQDIYPEFEPVSEAEDSSPPSTPSSLSLSLSLSPSPSPPALPPLPVESPPIDEEARIRADKHAKQQEEFRKRAEDIKRRNAERRLRQKQGAWAGSETSSSSSDDGTTFRSSPSPPPPKTPVGVISDDDIVKLFIFHDQQWTRISAYHTLRWSDFPWPVLSFTGPKDGRDLTQVAVSAYILSAFDWQRDKIRSKERLKEHLRKWHPDRFETKFLSRVPESGGERERVRHASGMVVRFLNELLGRFNNLDG